MNSHTIIFFLQNISVLLQTVCENFQYSNLSEHVFILGIITQNANEKAQCSLVKITHPNKKKRKYFIWKSVYEGLVTLALLENNNATLQFKEKDKTFKFQRQVSTEPTAIFS